MSGGTRDTSLASDTETENASKGKSSEHPSGFSATNAARQKPSRKQRLETASESEVSEKGHNKYAGFKRFCVVPKNDQFN